MSNPENISQAPQERRIVEKIAVGLEAAGFLLMMLGLLTEEGSVALLGVGYIGAGDYFDKHAIEMSLYKEISPVLDNVEWVE